MIGIVEQATIQQQAAYKELDHLRTEAAELREVCSRLEAKLAAAVQRIEEIRAMGVVGVVVQVGRKQQLRAIADLAFDAILEAGK